MSKQIPGQKFRDAVATHKPLQVVGVINAYAAIMAEQIGFHALYLSGAGVSNASYGLPDLGMTSLDNVLEDTRRITDAVNLPLLVDIDTGWGSSFTVGRAVRLMEKAGAAAVHIEDQPLEKRCGHRPGKQVVSQEEMVGRIKAAVDARVDSAFVIMARTDAYAVEGLDRTIDRCRAYEAFGADMLFIEALPSLEEYRLCVEALEKPILANITEFGKTPLFTKEELAEAGVSLILHPLSAWRAMNLAALKVYSELLEKGTQKHILDSMQTREELYGFLNYATYEQQEDERCKK